MKYCIFEYFMNVQSIKKCTEFIPSKVSSKYTVMIKNP